MEAGLPLFVQEIQLMVIETCINTSFTLVELVTTSQVFPQRLPFKRRGVQPSLFRWLKTQYKFHFGIVGVFLSRQASDSSGGLDKSEALMTMVAGNSRVRCMKIDG